jgi:hypothetical protein
MTSRSRRTRIRRIGVAFMMTGFLFAAVVPERPHYERPMAAADEAGVSDAQATAAPALSPAPVEQEPASPDPATTLAPKRSFGDLKNLQATATGNLIASFLAPEDGSASQSLATSVQILTVQGATLRVEVNGEPIDDTHLGELTTDTGAHTAKYTYYGLPLKPGPNHIVVVPLGANNAAGPLAELTVYGPGRPVSFEERLVKPLVADGASTSTLEVTAIDAWGNHAQPGSVVKVTIASGDVHFAKGVTPISSPVPSAPNADASPTSAPANGLAATVAPVNPSIDLAIASGGVLNIPLAAGLAPGPVTIHISSGDAVADANFYESANIRKPFVNGLVTGGVGSVPDAPQDAPGVPNGPNSRKGRVAVYGTGGVGQNGLLTVSYDTADKLDESSATGANSFDPSDRPFATYGDSSTVRDDALSRDHLYARYDQGQSHAMWGEFQANTGGTNSVGGFSQLVDGLQVAIANKGRDLSGFVARNDIAYGRVVLSPSGLSTLAQPLNPDIVVGSENVSVVAIDRRTGIILSQTQLVRNVDYTLDYVSGQIRFITIPLPFDEFLNPQSILITYEYGGASVHSQVFGGRFDSTLGNGSNPVKFGAGYVNDGNGVANYSLFTQELSGGFRGGSWSLAHAMSDGNINDPTASVSSLDNAAGSGGEAFKGTFSKTAGSDHFTADFDDTSQGYSNPFGGLTSPGLFDYRADYGHTFKSAALDLEFDHEYNNYDGAESAQSNASLKLRKAVGKKLNLTAGVGYVSTSSGTAFAPVPGVSPDPLATPIPVTAAAAIQATFGADWKTAKWLDLSASRTQNLGEATVASAPTETVAQATFDFGPAGRAYIRELFSASPTDSVASSTADYTAVASATHLTTFGFEKTLGKNTTIDDEYDITQGAGGTTLTAVSGVKEKFLFGKYLRGDASFQRADGNTDSAFLTYSGTLSYTPSNKFRVSTSVQDRTGTGAGLSLFASAIGAVSDDLSAYADINRNEGAGIESTDDRVGLAWRPSESERGVTLFGYRQTSGVSALGGQAGVLSLEQIYRPTNNLELAGTYDYKLDGDDYFAAKTAVFGIRATQKLGQHFDIGAEYEATQAVDVPAAGAQGLAIETGVRTGPMRVAVGYNVRAIADPSLTNTSSHKGFYLTVTSLVDRFFGWGQQH